MIGASKSIWGFDPRSVPGCVVWLDAADSNTLTLSGSNITAWRDKSTFSNNVNSISAIPPTYNSADSSVNFVASSGTFLRGTMSATYSNSASVFVVASIASQSTPAFPRISSLGLSSTANSILVGQFLLVNGGNPSVITYLATNTNPSGQGTNIMTLVSNVTYNTKQLITNVSTRAVASATDYTISTLLNGNSQNTSVSTRTGTGFTANATNIASYNKYSLANYPDAASTTGDSYNGKIFEYLVFNTQLTTEQCRKIEGYLGNKWGINTLLPNTSPYYYIKPHLTNFLPTDIRGCELWFDGLDYKTMFQNTAGTTPVTDAGQSVACWKDKIRNISISNTGVYASTLPPTSVSQGGVFFNNIEFGAGSANHQGLASTLTGASNQTQFFFRTTNKLMTLITASYPLSNNNTRKVCILGSSPTGSTVPNFVLSIPVGQTNGGLLSFDFNGSTYGQNLGQPVVYNSNTVLRIDSLVTNSNPTFRTNGTSNTMTSTSYPALSISNYPVNAIFMGAYNTFGGNANFHGTIYEMLFYSRILTIAEQEQVEGYLAWKWGMTASLPAGHLYKTIPTAESRPYANPITSTGSFLVKYNSGGGNPEWVRTTTTGSFRSVCVDSSDNVIGSGVFSQIFRIFSEDGTTTEFPTIPLVGGEDCFVVKYTKSGKPLWVRRIAGNAASTYQQPLGSCVDSSDNIIVCGQYNASSLLIYGNNNTGASFSLSNSGISTFDGFIVKYNSIGVALWARRVGGTISEVIRSVSTDSSRNVIAVGEYSSTTATIFAANGSTAFATVSRTGNTGIFIVKYDQNGTPLWVRRVVGGANGSQLIRVSTDSSGNIIVAGWFQPNSLIIYNSDNTTTFTTLTNSGNLTQDCIIIKYNSSGTPLWARKSVGGTGDDRINSVCVDSSGNIIVGGEFYSSPATIFNVDNTTAFTTLTNSGISDAFVVKYDSNGTPLWARKIGGASSSDLVNSVSVDSNGNVTVVGDYNSDLLNIFAADGSTVSFSLTNIYGNRDSFVVKYDSNGTPLWARKISGAGGELSYSVSTDSSGNVIVGGNTTSNPLNFYA